MLLEARSGSYFYINKKIYLQVDQLPVRITCLMFMTNEQPKTVT